MCKSKDCQHGKESPIKDWKHRCQFGPDGKSIESRKDIGNCCKSCGRIVASRFVKGYCLSCYDTARRKGIVGKGKMCKCGNGIAIAKGQCNACRISLKKNGLTEKASLCACGKFVNASGMCHNCYRLKQRILNGSRLQKYKGKPISITHPECIEFLVDKSIADVKTVGSRGTVEWFCTKCGKICSKTFYHRLIDKIERCKRCATSGFKTSKNSILYLVARTGQFKVGIANNGSGRLRIHKRNGWVVIDSIEAMGDVVLNLEAHIKNVMKSCGVKTGKECFPQKFDGWTESWSESELKVGTIRELTTKLGINLEAFLAA